MIKLALIKESDYKVVKMLIFPKQVSHIKHKITIHTLVMFFSIFKFIKS